MISHDTGVGVLISTLVIDLKLKNVLTESTNYWTIEEKSFLFLICAQPSQV